MSTARESVATIDPGRRDRGPVHGRAADAAHGLAGACAQACQNDGERPKRRPVRSTRSTGNSVADRPNALWCPTSHTSPRGRVSSTSPSSSTRLRAGSSCWRASRTAHAGFVLDALDQALHERRPVRGSGLVHHSDRGVQIPLRSRHERLKDAGVEPSVGSVGDSYDNALAETINGLYKAEVIWRRGHGATSRRSSLHARVGRLVQQSQTAGTDRKTFHRRSRSALLCADRGARFGGVTQTKWPPANPGRFIPVAECAWRRWRRGARGRPSPNYGNRSLYRWGGYIDWVVGKSTGRALPPNIVRRPQCAYGRPRNGDGRPRVMREATIGNVECWRASTTPKIAPPVSISKTSSRAALARRWPGLRVNRLTGRWRDDASGASIESLLAFLNDGGAP